MPTCFRASAFPLYYCTVKIIIYILCTKRNCLILSMFNHLYGYFFDLFSASHFPVIFWGAFFFELIFSGTFFELIFCASFFRFIFSCTFLNLFSAPRFLRLFFRVPFLFFCDTYFFCMNIFLGNTDGLFRPYSIIKIRI